MFQECFEIVPPSPLTHQEWRNAVSAGEQGRPRSAEVVGRDIKPALFARLIGQLLAPSSHPSAQGARRDVDEGNVGQLGVFNRRLC